MTVPETPVNEYCFPLPSKDNIRPTGQIIRVKAVSKAETIHELPDSQFGSSVFRPDCAHHLRATVFVNDVGHALVRDDLPLRMQQSHRRTFPLLGAGKHQNIGEDADHIEFNPTEACIDADGIG